jgi:hypothetical protein
MRSATVALAGTLALGLAGAAAAQDLKVTEQFKGTVVGFDLGGTFSNVTLSISGPNFFHTSRTSRTGPPEIDLKQFGTVDDGQYNYQLTASTEGRLQVRTPLDDGRSGGATTTGPFKTVSTSGVINVKDGVIVPRDPGAKEPQQKRR